MATILRSYIFITFIVCCISFAILVTSVSTTSWVEANLISYAGDDSEIVSYGLFVGTLINAGFVTRSYYTIHMACIPKENVCAWSCLQSAEEREEEVQNLYTVADAIFHCKEKDSRGIRSLVARRNRRNIISEPPFYPRTSSTKSTLNDICKNDTVCTGKNEYCKNGTCSCTSGSTVSMDHTKCEILRGPIDKKFINLGIWASTLASLILTIVFAGIAAVGAIVNIAANPVRTIAAIPGLYLWNGIAAFFAALTLVLWGSHFAATLMNNIAVRDTITGEYHVDTSKVGFSYWLILGSALLHLANIGILFLRRVMLLRIPEPPKVTPVEDADGTLFLY